MSNATVFDDSDPSFRRANDIIAYCMTFGQVGALLFCLVALELLPLVIDTFKEEKGLRRIRILRWFTVFFFLIVMVASVSSIPNLHILPDDVGQSIAFLLFLWPTYALTLQMTALIMLLKHLVKQFEKYVRQSPEASKKLMKVLKAMIVSNVIGMSLFGIGAVNFLYTILKAIPPQWDILLMMLGFNIFFITLTLLTFYIFNVKKVAVTQATVTDYPSISIMKPVSSKFSSEK